MQGVRASALEQAPEGACYRYAGCTCQGQEQAIEVALMGCHIIKCTGQPTMSGAVGYVPDMCCGHAGCS